MAQEIELSDCSVTYEPSRAETNQRHTEESDAESTQRRLLRLGILTLGVLCILQATLNISLFLAFYTKEDTDQLPFNSSLMADMCQSDQSQQSSPQLCSCCNNLLRRLLREHKALETERDLLRNKVVWMTQDNTRMDDDFQSGSGSGEDLFIPDV